MPLVAPNLDDRSFEEIFADVRRLVPRYAPEWTDHNESDPGVTLLQLFSWLTEMTLYRLNRVPERNYVKFLRLVGIELAPARPARAELTFELARDDLETVIVPRGTQVASAGAPEEGGEPVVFETADALTALGARLAAVQSFDGFAYSLETARAAAEGQWFHPFGAHARDGSALVLGFDSPLPFTARQVDLSFEVFDDPARRQVLLCDPVATPPPATLVWEYWDQHHWQPLVLEQDTTRAFTRGGHVVVRGPGERAKKDTLGAVDDLELYWLRCRLVRGAWERPPRLDTVLTNTVAATQSQTVRDEVLGGSDGRPGQVFTVAQTPVLGGLRLEVNEGSGEDDFEVWQEVDDFFASGPDDAHYVLNRTTGEVSFGDGRRGRVPLANPDFPTRNVVAREYRFGGGRAGNVGAGTLTELQTLIDGVAEVTNRRAALGGSEEETVDEAKLRAAGTLKARGRAVTPEDFELLARETAGVRVRRAKALPLAHPRFPGARIPGAVTVVVVPDAEGPRPTPGEATLRAVCEHLDRRRLLTTEVHVVAPEYHEVTIEADVVARPEADLAEVQRAADATLHRFFHPLTGGEDGTGWPFGGDVFYSRVYRVLLDVPGVDRIRDNQLLIRLDGELRTFCRDVPLPDGSLPFSGQHQVRMAYGFEE